MENIRAHQEIFEQLYAVSFPLRIFLERHLAKISPFGWWYRFVLPYLENDNSRNHKRKHEEDINSLDIYYMTKIILGNWNDLKNIDANTNELFSEDNKVIVRDVFNIRNKIAHQCYDPGINLTTFKKDCPILAKFAMFIGYDMNDCIQSLHKDEKTRVLNFISSKVLLPALESEILDAKTKASVRNTYQRLQQANRAREIVDFFHSSLQGIRGQEIYNNLKACGLKAFEDIKDEVDMIYFGEHH